MRTAIVKMSDVLKNNPNCIWSVDYVLAKVENNEIVNQADTLKYKIKMFIRRIKRKMYE